MSKFSVIILCILILGEISSARTSVGNISRTRKAKSEATKIARQKQSEADVARMTARYVTRDPYVPQKYDYGLEGGAMWRGQNMYWMGMNAGLHIGTCIFSFSQRCQQYVDTILGVGGSDGYTHFLGLGSLRWQFMDFPSSWSPMARLIAGINASVEPTGTFQRFAYGVGVGVTTYLHPRVDLRVEGRLLQTNQLDTQVLVSMQLKIDKWVKYFADRIKDVGIGTITVPIQAVDAAVGATGDIIGISDDDKNKDKTKKKSSSP